MTKEIKSQATEPENSLKSKIGRPIGEPTVTPSLRCKKSDWENLKKKYPRGINKLFNEFVTALLQK